MRRGSRARPASRREPAAQLVRDMDADDLLEGVLCRETELSGATGLAWELRSAWGSGPPSPRGSGPQAPIYLRPYVFEHAEWLGFLWGGWRLWIRDSNGVAKHATDAGRGHITNRALLCPCSRATHQVGHHCQKTQRGCGLMCQSQLPEH
jgi:hypothetical protein